MAKAVRLTERRVPVLALAVALVFGLPWVAVAQEPLTLRGAAAAALVRHPSMHVAEAGIAQAAAAVRQSGAALQPAVTVDAQMTRFQEPMVVAPLHGFDPASPPLFHRTLAQGALSAGWVAFDGGARSSRVEAAARLRDGASAGLESARQALLVEVVRRYAAVLVARELESAHGARASTLEQERERAARLLEQGRTARVSVLRAQAALSGARAELSAAATHTELAERELARVMGVRAGSLRGVVLATAEVTAALAPGPAAPLAAAPSRGGAVGVNPELTRLAAHAAAGRAAVAEARAEWWPRLQLGGRYVQYGSGAGSAAGEWQAGFQLSYPLFTAGSRAAGEARAVAAWRTAEAELALAELRVAEAVDRAAAAARAAGERAVAWRAAVEQSEEVARIERLALDTGGGVQTDYLAAEAELLRARAALTEARYAELVARVELARAVGELTVEWLAVNVESGT
jgi:outer membrane protein TolC